MNKLRNNSRLFILSCLFLLQPIIYNTYAFASRPLVKSNDIDLLHYDMKIDADPVSLKLKGTVSIDFEVTNPAFSDSIDFLLAKGYRVISIYNKENPIIPFNRVLEGEPVPELHPGLDVKNWDWSFIRISANFFKYGKKQNIIIEYEGERTLGMIIKESMIQMHDIPARWYPFRLDDPATAICSINTPDSIRAVFGGKLLKVEKNKRQKSWLFETEFALNYFPLLVGNWIESNDKLENIDLIFIHKKDYPNPLKILRLMNQCLSILKSPWFLGKYPYSQLVFVEYPHYSREFGIAMSGGIIGFDLLSRELSAHEISHQWWGCSVFSEHKEGYIFINEAFASYSGAMFLELALGSERMTEGFISFQLTNHRNEINKNNLLNCSPGLQYGKGAYVVHTLRKIMGDDKFFRAVHTYLKENMYSMSNLDILINTFEKEYGESLDWFFNQWLKRKGLPNIEFDYNIEHPSKNKSIIEVTIRQNGDLYDLPITISFKEKLKTKYTVLYPIKHIQTIWIRDRNQKWEFTIDGNIEKVTINEDKWILHEKLLEEIINRVR